AVPQDLVGAAPAFLARVADADQRHIGEALLCDWAAGLGRLLAIGLEDRRRAHPAGVEHADRHPALGRLHRAAGAADRHPYRRMRLLPRPRPDIDLTVMEMGALPVERAVMARHCLQDQ